MNILPKDLQKGDKVMLKNGWIAEVRGKAKGIRIFLLVHGYASELGDTYTRDVEYRMNPDGSRDAVVLAPAHQKQFDSISKEGF